MCYDSSTKCNLYYSLWTLSNICRDICVPLGAYCRNIRLGQCDIYFCCQDPKVHRYVLSSVVFTTKIIVKITGKSTYSVPWQRASNTQKRLYIMYIVTACDSTPLSEHLTTQLFFLVGACRIQHMNTRLYYSFNVEYLICRKRLISYRWLGEELITIMSIITRFLRFKDDSPPSHPL